MDCVCVCVGVCVGERGKGRNQRARKQRGKEKEGWIQELADGSNECVCACVCGFVCVRAKEKKMIQADAVPRDKKIDRKNARERITGRFRNCWREEKGVSETEERKESEG